MTGLFVFQAILLLNTDYLLGLFGQPTDVRELTQIYIYYWMPGIFMYIQFEIMRRFLFCQGVYNPILYTMLFTWIIHIANLYILVIVLDMKIVGAAIATTITFTLNFVILNIATSQNLSIVKSHRWFFADREAYSKIMVFLEFGVPASFMSVMDWWGLDVIWIFAGWIGVKPLAASIIMFQMLALWFMNALGITFAATSLVGNSLGANLPNMARKYANATMLFGLICTWIMLFLYILFKDFVVGWFTDDSEVHEAFDGAFPYYIIAIFFDMTQGVSGGIIRAMGYQRAATFILLFSIWVVMDPFAYMFGFVFQLGYRGLWMGVPFGNFFMMAGYFLIIIFADWKQLATEASKHHLDEEIVIDASMLQH